MLMLTYSVQSILRRSMLNTECWKRFHSSTSYLFWASYFSSSSFLCGTTSGDTARFGYHRSLHSPGSPDAMPKPANSLSPPQPPRSGPIRHGRSAHPQRRAACRRNDRRCRSRGGRAHRIGGFSLVGKSDDQLPRRRGLLSHETTNAVPLPRGGTHPRGTRHRPTCSTSPTRSLSLYMSGRQRGRCETSICEMHRPGGDATMWFCYDIDEARSCW